MLARDMPHLMSYAYLVADDQEMFVVETHPELVRVREAEADYIAATNHFLHGDLRGLMRSPVQSNSERRLQTVESRLSEAPDASERWETAASILTDHDTPMCGHTDGMATLWSMIADLTNQRLAYSLGAPCRNQYQDLPWPGTAGDMAAMVPD
jgi:hypothetical protein